MEDEFFDCFTETGICASTSRWSTSRRYEGRAQQRAFFAQHTHAPATYHKHLVVESRITIDGGRARVESYFVRVDDSAVGPYIWSFGRYKDVLVRCDDGRWRLSERNIESENGRREPPPV